MATKRFINTDSMQPEILELLKKEYLSKQFYGEKIEIKLDLKEIVERKMKEQNLIEPLIYITVNAYQKILTLVKEFNSEVAWHCLVEHPAGTNAYLIYDILIFPQEVTSGTANGIDGDYEMWMANQPDETFEKIRCHMHSHVKMGTTPSGVDENYRNNLMTQVTDYYIFMIINKKSEYTLAFYDKTNNILYDDLSITVCFEDGTTLNTWFESVKGLVKERTYTPTYTSKKDEKETKQSSFFDDDYNYSYIRERYEDYDKKKDIDTGTKKRGRPKKKEEEDTRKESKYIRIQGPENDIHRFVSIDHAVNYIYNQYPDANHAFSKNNMRKFLAKKGAIAYDPSIKNFIYDFLDKDSGLEYAILKCDLWEVLKYESK